MADRRMLIGRQPASALICRGGLVDSRWRWLLWDSMGHLLCSSRDEGYSRIEDCARNLSAVLGCPVELVKHGGRYNAALIVGRPIIAEVER